MANVSMIIPLDVILTSIGKTLGPISEEERESDTLFESLPRIDRQTLNQDHECSICHRVFKSPAGTSPTPAPIPTPLKIPCSYIICEDCLDAWLSKAGSCRLTLTSRVFQGGDSVADTQIQLRVVFRKVLHCGQLYLETKSPGTNFGEMWEWARNVQSEEQRRAWKAMRLFQDYKTKVEQDLLLTESGQAILAGVWDACGVNLIYPDRAKGSEQNENESVATVVGETWAVVGAEHDAGESEVVGESEDAWETLRAILMRTRGTRVKAMKCWDSGFWSSGIGEKGAVVGAEHDASESEVVGESEDAWETYESETYGLE